MTILLNKVTFTSKKNGKTYTKFALYDEDNCDAFVSFLEGEHNVPLGEVSVSYDRNGRMIDIKKKGA